MRVRVGSVLVAIGVVHQLFGVLVGWPVLMTMTREGLVNSVGPDMTRNALFWFFMTGVVIILLGWFMAEMEAQDVVIPTAFGWALLAVTLASAALLPASGLWLLAIPAVLTLVRARDQGAKGPRSGSTH